MYGKKVKLRILFISLLLISIILSIFLILKSLEENVVYFFSPTEIKSLTEIKNKKIRVGGMVKKGSVYRETNSLKVSFEITDFQEDLTIEYEGILPDLFSEDAGVVLQGVINSRGIFVAHEVLAKHDENYMPPEVARTLKQKK